MICYALRHKSSKKYYDNVYGEWVNCPSDATLYRYKEDVINLLSDMFQFEGEDAFEIVEIELTVKEE